jgi:hypothetical protein
MNKSNKFSVAIGLLLAIVLLTNCGKKVYPPTAETTYLSNPNPGVVSITAVGYGSTEKEAEYDGFITGFETILFKGLPAFGSLSSAMIKDEAKARSEHQAFFKQFFESRGYLQFVVEQGVMAKLGKSDQPGKIRVQKNFSINYDALRKKLEQEGVIRKFGY